MIERSAVVAKITGLVIAALASEREVKTPT